MTIYKMVKPPLCAYWYPLSVFVLILFCAESVILFEIFLDANSQKNGNLFLYSLQALNPRALEELER